MAKRNGLLIAVGFILTVACASAYAQQTVYKWVDENGVVHFSEKPPKETPDTDVEVVTTDPPPPHAPRAAPKVNALPPATARVESRPAQPETRMPAVAGEADISQMSLAELDRRCEAAREARIAPMRAAQIENCIEAGTGDRAWCENFWADYGAASRTPSGEFIPGMFYDLPECIEAWEEGQRRALYPE